MHSFTEALETFTKVKRTYEKLREEQRIIIVNFLNSKGFEVSKNPGAGKGSKHYKGGGTIEEFDLSNWKYVIAKRRNQEVLISLNSFDVDKCTRNRHVLYDRIGLYAYKKYVPEEACCDMAVTNIDLPMSEEKLKALVLAIEEQFSKSG